MPLIIQNNTAGDIELVELGLTVPASETYDLTLRSPVLVAADAELTDHISSGNLSVTADTLNTLANATGYQRIASGTTAARPLMPTPGTIRFNETTGFVEMYQAGAWQNFPNLRDVEFKADPATSVLYRKTADNKWLSVTFSSLTFANSNAADKSWIYIDSNITNTFAGYTSAFYGTITYVGAYTDTTGVTKTLSVYVNEVEHSNAITFTGSQTSNSVAQSIDFDPGDTVRFRMRSETRGKLGAIYITTFFCLRDPE